MARREMSAVKRIDQQFLELQVESLAKKSGFRRRQPRKIAPTTFLKAACLLSLQKYHSLRSLAATLAILTKKTVSKQALAQRLTPEAVAFVRQVLCRLIASQSNCVAVKQSGAFAPFRRVLVADSTSIRLNPQLASLFPGSRNHTDKVQAMAKIQSSYDILSETFSWFEVTPFTKNDQSASKEVLSFLRKGDLLIRDLGYYSHVAFKIIIRMQAFFLSRLQYGVSLFASDGKPLDLLRRLRKQPILDINILLGTKDKIPLRLVAVPVPQDVADERRRKMLQNRDQNLNPSKKHLALLGWSIFITNVPQSCWNTDIPAQVYSIRWRIEIIFKSWKSHFHMKDFASASACQVQVLIYSRLIFITLFHSHFFTYLNGYAQRQNGKPLSLISLASFLDQHLYLLANLSSDYHHFLCQLITYYCSYEKRSRKNFYHLIELLT